MRFHLSLAPAALLAAAFIPTLTPAAETGAPAAVSGLRTVLELPPRPGNPRNSEGAFVPLKDGRLLFVYTHFTGGAADNAKAHLASRVSSDGGLTWSDKDVVIPTAGAKENVMSVSSLRLAPDRIGLFYLVKNSWTDCRMVMQTSADEGATWSAPGLCIPDTGYFVVNNDRLLRLKSGRIVVPAAIHNQPDGKKFNPTSSSTCYLSDDAGRTWRRAKTTLLPPDKSRTGLQEPLVQELTDGRLMMLMRTDQGCQMRSYSGDGGETWSPAEKTDIHSPVSPASVRRIPSTGDLLMVWNNTTGGKRTPMTIAVSRDEGKTWPDPRDIETDPEGWYCYTAIQFVGSDGKDPRVLLAYCAGEPRNRLGRTRIVSIPVASLYSK